MADLTPTCPIEGTPRWLPPEGLGLAITRLLCEPHGRHHVGRQPGGRGFDASPWRYSPLRRGAAGLTRDSLLSGKRLLIVDGDASSPEVLAEWGRRWGMTVSAGDCPGQVRSWLGRGEPFDAALVDLQCAGGEVGELALAGDGDRLPVVALAPIGHRLGTSFTGLAGWVTRLVGDAAAGSVAQRRRWGGADGGRAHLGAGQGCRTAQF